MYQAEFKVLTDGAKATPAEAALAGKALAEQYDLDMFIEHIIEPLRAAYAQGNECVCAKRSSCEAELLAQLVGAFANTAGSGWIRWPPVATPFIPTSTYP